MNMLLPVLELLRNLYEADDRLQSAFRDLVQRYFQFLKTWPRGVFRSVRHLRIRADRDGRGRIRRLAWTVRIRATRTVAGKPQWLTRRLPGPLRHEWVYRLAKDWPRLEAYKAFERERVTLNTLHSNTVDALRRLRLALENSWTRRATPQDRAELDRLFPKLPSYLQARDLRPLVGAVALDREFRCLESDLGTLIESYRRTYENSLSVSFEPALRPTEGGALRLYWGFPQRVGTSEGIRTFTVYIPGRPTDRWMRRQRVPVSLRVRIGAFQKLLIPLERRYRRLVDFLRGHRRGVHKILVRIAKLAGPRLAPGAPEAFLGSTSSSPLPRRIPCPDATLAPSTSVPPSTPATWKGTTRSTNAESAPLPSSSTR